MTSLTQNICIPTSDIISLIQEKSKNASNKYVWEQLSKIETNESKEIKKDFQFFYRICLRYFKSQFFFGKPGMFCIELDYKKFYIKIKDDAIQII